MDYHSVEVKKLIELAYHLHEGDMQCYFKYDLDKREDGVEFVPLFEDGFIGHPLKKLDNGVVCGYIHKEFGHSSAIPSTILDVVIGKFIEQGFIYDMAMRLHLKGSLSNEDISERDLYILMLKPDLTDCTQEEFPIIRGKKRKNFLDFDRNMPELAIDGGYGDFIDDNAFDNMDEAKKLEIFTKVMGTLGFRREAVIALLKGEMNAEEVFMEVAPPELASKRVLYWNQRKYTFSNNVLVNIMPLDVEVGADIGASLDDLPFPFSEAAIIDASLVNTYGIDFGENARRHRLINVNSNPQAIYRAKLKNAVIDEPIDLSIVDATGTEFGHHIIINIDKAIGNLAYTDFLYAVDEKGKRFNIDCYGRLSSEIQNSPTPLQNESIKDSIKVLVDASDYESAIEGFNNGADGIGLVRIEDVLKVNGIPVYKTIYITNDDTQRREVIEQCGTILKEEAKKILSLVEGKRVVFRLLDAKLGELLTEEQIYWHFFSKQELRGDLALCKYPEFLETQARSILESALETKNAVDILVPLNHSIDSIREVREAFKKVADEIGYYDFRIGAMVEYVFFANRLDYITEKADFIAIGLNDLTEDVTKLSRTSRDKCFALLDDRVKEILRECFYRARIANPDISIGLCGLHTNFAENLEFFRELQVNHITCNASFIPTAKRLLSSEEIHPRLSFLPKKDSNK